MKAEHHEIDDRYTIVNRDGSESRDWKIAYVPLFGSFKNGKWIHFNEERALVEKPIKGGIDFREIPIRFLKLQT